MQVVSGSVDADYTKSGEVMSGFVKYLSIIWVLSISIATADPRLPDFTPLVESNHPAVVNISILKHMSTENHPNIPDLNDPELRDSPLGDFLRRFLEQNPGHGNSPEPREFDSRASGSGFIISEDGFVLTNNHVVEGADAVTVRLTDRRQFTAKVVGTDKRSDVALLKIDADGLPVVKTGSADTLEVGEWVLAIGSPFGFDFSVTAGIVSAKQRALPNEGYVPFIQTDVAINPRNSGGPLFNMDGEVVGINSQIYSRSGGFMGLSFAIPIDIAMDVANQLKNSGSVSRGWLGVVIQQITRDLAESFGMDRARGALIARILPNSPAAYSDLQVGDVIVEFNGKSIDRSSYLPPVVGRSSLEKPATVVIFRDGKEQTLSVTLGELPSEDELLSSSGNNWSPGLSRDNVLKIEVAETDEEIMESLALEQKAIVIEEVFDGPAMDAGLQAGDVILSVDNQSVASIEDFSAVLDTLKPGGNVPVLVQRASGPVFLAVKIPE